MSLNIRKTASTILVSAILLSSTGCANKPYKQVYYAAEAFANAIVEMDADGIIELSSDDLSDRESEKITAMCNYDDMVIGDNLDFINSIRDTISYTIDAGSLTASGNKGSVKVTFTVADWESVSDNDDNMESLSDANKALKNADVVSYTINIKFENDGKKWLVTNTSDVTDDVYDFTDESFFMLFDSSEIGSAEWWFTDAGIVNVFDDPSIVPVYTNTDMLDLDIHLSDLTNYQSTYYKVFKDGQLVYTSGLGQQYGYYNFEHGATLNEYGYIDPGTYTISFYHGDVCIFSGTCTVQMNIE